MATTNKQRIGDVLDLVVAGLGPWLDQRMAAKYGPDWQTVVAQTINDGRDMIQSMDDPAFVFRVFDKMWIPMLKDQLTYEDRRCVSSLWDTRKQWAHGGKFTDEQAERALSDAEHVLRAVGSIAEADQVDLMRRDLRRVRFEKDQAHYQAQTEKTLAVQVDTAGLPPWREVVEPHDDVARGEFELAQFAADLRLVAQGRSGPEYSDPTQFFQRTYLTRGLRYLLTQTAKRLNGVGGEPVIDLMTTFGGGKTHSEIAVYHAGSGTPVDQMPGMQEVLDAAGVESLPSDVSRAVIVGNDLSVLGSTKPDGTVVNTMWGEIAWQLGGVEAFAMVARFDEHGDPPPTGVLEELFRAHAPVIILIDEWVAYLRQLYSRPETPPGGSFDGHMTFVQSLTEATKAVPTAMLVVSLPASDNVRDMGEGLAENSYEIGGTPGLEALRHLRSVIHRLESPWQPADIEESYEIVRRRLFKPLATENLGARDVTLQRFSALYHKHANELPSEVRQPGYYDTMKAAYPIHPELFKRLYEDWSTLERFQRTRGVLRLMATVVHALWQRGDMSALITPATIPLDDQKVFEEITTHLDDPWKPVVDADIAGDTSTANMIDREIPLLGRTMAARRVARCVFLGTAPAANGLNQSSADGAVRGIEAKRVILGATYPGDNPAHLADALRVLGDRGAFMNRDGDRYWLSLQQTVQRLVQERADGLSDDEVATELTRIIRAETDRGIFDRVHRWPSDSAAIEDDPSIGLVIFGTDHPYTRKTTSDAETEALRCIQFRGTNARIHKNTLIFFAPDLERVDSLNEAVRKQLAWQYVLDNVGPLNLDQHNITVAKSRRDQASQTVNDRIRDTYRWILVPHQQPGEADIELETILVNSAGTLVERVTRKAESNEIVLRSFTPALVRREIDKLRLWDKEPHVQVDRLMNLFTQYLYMPKVANHDVVKTAIQHLDDVLLVDQDGFAYADSIDSDGRYQGLVMGVSPTLVSGSGLIVKPQTAEAQIAAETKPTPETPTPRGGVQPPAGGTSPPTTTPGAVAHTRFHATKKLDPLRAVRDLSQLNEELIIHCLSTGVAVNTTEDIDSDALGQPPADKRAVVEENLRALQFDDWQLE